MLNGFRLAVGMLTVLPVPFHGTLDRRTARWAMLLAPVAVLPLAVLVGLVVWAGTRSDVAPLGVGFAAVGVLALGTRALHLDGLSDVADGLTASYDRERSLAVMKTGTSGPAGTAAVVIVLGIQAAAFGSLRFGLPPFASGGLPPAVIDGIVAGLLVCFSRAALLLTCARGVPAARPDGLGNPFAATVPRTVAVLGWVLVALVLEAVCGSGPLERSWHGIVPAALAVAAVLLLVRRAVHRFGGVTGDVYGAAIEIALAVLAVGASGGPLFLAG